MAERAKGRAIDRPSPPPDVGGKSQAVELLAQMLAAAQGERRKLQMTMTANDHALTDPVPWRPAATYGEAMDEAGQQERRLCEAYPDEAELLREQINKRDGGGA